jgi:hypothetical protein
MSSIEDEPRVSPRARLLRPDLLTDEITGRLAPSVLLAYLGLTSRADDAGFLVWHPTALATAVMPYANPSRRIRDMERITDELCRVGLLHLHACGCAELPRVVRDHAMKGGNKSYAVRDWHLAHAETIADGHGLTDTDQSVSSSGSGSFTESESGSSSGPASESRSASGSGWRGAGGCTDGEWLDRLHRLGLALDRRADQTWVVWRTSLRDRHDDQTLLDAVRTVIESGETRPELVRELAREALTATTPSRR